MIFIEKQADKDIYRETGRQRHLRRNGDGHLLRNIQTKTFIEKQADKDI